MLGIAAAAAVKAALGAFDYLVHQVRSRPVGDGGRTSAPRPHLERARRPNPRQRDPRRGQGPERPFPFYR